MKAKEKKVKTKCHNCLGSGKPTDALGLVYNIRACAKTKCLSWPHREYKLGSQI